jgi:hypothetical protein
VKCDQVHVPTKLPCTRDAHSDGLCEHQVFQGKMTWTVRWTPKVTKAALLAIDPDKDPGTAV